MFRSRKPLSELLDHVAARAVGPEEVVLYPTDPLLLRLLHVPWLDTLLPGDVLVLGQVVVSLLGHNINGVIDLGHVPDEFLALASLVVDVEVHVALEPQDDVHGYNQVVLVGVELVTKCLLLIRLHVQTYNDDLVFNIKQV